MKKKNAIMVLAKETGGGSGTLFYSGGLRNLNWFLEIWKNK